MDAGPEPNDDTPAEGEPAAGGTPSPEGTPGPEGGPAADEASTPEPQIPDAASTGAVAADTKPWHRPMPRWVAPRQEPPGRWTLLHRVKGDFGELGRAGVGKQRNAEGGAAEGREG